MKKHHYLPSKFIHTNSRVFVRGMQLTIMLIDKISATAKARNKFNELTAIRSAND